MKYAIFAIVAVAVAVFTMTNSGGVTSTLAQSPPPAPDSIAAVNGPNPGEAIISWAAVGDATHYRIGWIAYEDYDAIIAAGRPWSEGFAFVDVENLGQTSRTVTRLTPGILYAFIVGSNDTQYGAPQWSAWAQLTLNDDASSCPTDPTGPPTTVVAGDYDADDDGLIEIRTLAQLDAIRYDPDGDNRITSDDDEEAYYSAFPKAIAGMGCPFDGCIGFELAANLDFDTNGNGYPDGGDAYWNGAAGWMPIGYGTGTGFTATFDGGGHTIANLYIDRERSDNVGLFSFTEAGSDIRGVGLVSASVTGSYRIGGLVGENELGHITDSYVTGSVTGNIYVGGLVGQNSGPITDSYFNGKVNGTGNYAGGLVGDNDSPGRITGGHATGRVSGNYYVGGLVGDNEGGAITGSYATSKVSGASYVGGLVGESGSSSTTTGSYATGSVTGTNYVGGLVGYSGSDTTTTGSYATGSVTGTSGLGGLVGYSGSYTTTTSSYATGSVTGTSDVGGLVGYSGSYTTITSSYATGSVTGTSYVGGLVGDISSSNFVISASYWDTQTTGQTSSDGSENREGKTTAELQTPTDASGIYVTWDPDVWDFGTSSQYPVLKAEGLSVADQR